MSGARAFSILAALAIGLSSCGGKADLSEMSAEDIRAYVRDPENGYVRTIEIGPDKVTVAWRPSELVSAREVEGRKLSGSEADSVRANFARYRYYALSFERNGRPALQAILAEQGQAAYAEALNAFSFRMAEHAYALCRGDTVRPLDAAMARTYGMAPTTDVLLSFPEAPLAEGPVELRLREFGLGTGDLKWRFE